MNLFVWPILLVSFLGFLRPASAQVVVNVGSVTLPTEASVAVETWRLGQWNQLGISITITSGINAAVTSVTVTDASQISINDQIVIDTEALNVTGKAGPVLTVTRGATITVAAAHASGATVHVCRWPNAIALFKILIRNEVNRILGLQKPPSITTLEAQIAASQAAIEAFRVTTVQ